MDMDTGEREFKGVLITFTKTNIQNLAKKICLLIGKCILIVYMLHVCILMSGNC